MSAQQFTTADIGLRCQGCGGMIPANTGIYLVGEAVEATNDSWACSPECGRAASIKRALEGLADRLEKAIDDLRVVTSGGIPAP